MNGYEATVISVATLASVAGIVAAGVTVYNIVDRISNALSQQMLHATDRISNGYRESMLSLTRQNERLQDVLERAYEPADEAAEATP